MLSVINYILSLTWLGDAAEKLNGNKTVVAGIGFVLSAIVLLLPRFFPELTGAADVAAKIAELLRGVGVNLQDFNGLMGAGVVWGTVHKITKRLEAKK